MTTVEYQGAFFFRFSCVSLDMLFDDLLSGTPEEKLKNYQAFNDPSNMFTKNVDVDDFTVSNRASMESQISAIQEDKEINLLDKLTLENENLTAMVNKPFGDTYFGRPETTIKVPYAKVTKPLVDLTKYDTDHTAQEIITKINNSSRSAVDKQYLKLLGARESDFRMNAVKGSYKGIYQFHPDTLKGIGYKMEDYLKNPEIQFEAALKYRDANLRELKNYQKQIGQLKDGVKVTTNGLGAMAHLLGAATVKDYFDGTSKTKLAKNGFKDGNGTHISEYLKMFSN